MPSCRRPAWSTTTGPTASATKRSDKRLFRFRFRGDRKQLDFKDQRGPGRDVLAGPLVAVGQVGRQIQLPFGADRHELQGFGPASDDLVDRERGRLATLVRAVELRAVDQRPTV